MNRKRAKKDASLKRKAFRWAAVSCVLAGFTLSVAATPQYVAAAHKNADKPSIVLINMDNFGYGELTDMGRN